MTDFRSLTLRQRLIGGFGALVLAVLALGVLQLGQLSGVKDTKERTGKQTAPHRSARALGVLR